VFCQCWHRVKSVLTSFCNNKCCQVHPTEVDALRQLAWWCFGVCLSLCNAPLWGELVGVIIVCWRQILLPINIINVGHICNIVWKVGCCLSPPIQHFILFSWMCISAQQDWILNSHLENFIGPHEDVARRHSQSSHPIMVRLQMWLLLSWVVPLTPWCNFLG